MCVCIYIYMYIYIYTHKENITCFLNFIIIIIIIFGCSVQCAVSLFPNQGSNPCSLLWKRGVLTAKLPGKSQYDLIWKHSLSPPVGEVQCLELGDDWPLRPFLGAAQYLLASGLDSSHRNLELGRPRVSPSLHGVVYGWLTTLLVSECQAILSALYPVIHLILTTQVFHKEWMNGKYRRLYFH